MARKVKYDPMIGEEHKAEEQRKISSEELFRRWADIRDVWYEKYGDQCRTEWDRNSRCRRVEELFLSSLKTITRQDIEEAIEKFINGDGDKYFGDDDAYFDAYGKERYYPPEPRKKSTRTAARHKRHTRRREQNIIWIY